MKVRKLQISNCCNEATAFSKVHNFYLSLAFQKVYHDTRNEAMAKMFQWLLYLPVKPFFSFTSLLFMDHILLTSAATFSTRYDKIFAKLVSHEECATGKLKTIFSVLCHTI